VCFRCHGTSSYHTTNTLQGRRTKSHVDTQTIQPGLGDFVLRGDGPKASTSCASEAARVKAELDCAALWVCFAYMPKPYIGIGLQALYILAVLQPESRHRRPKLPMHQPLIIYNILFIFGIIFEFYFFDLSGPVRAHARTVVPFTTPLTSACIIGPADWVLANQPVSTKVDKTQLYNAARIKWDSDGTEKKVNVIYNYSQILQI